MKKTIMFALLGLYLSASGAQAALITARHEFNGTKFVVGGDGTVVSTLTTFISFDDSTIVGSGIEYTDLLSYRLDFIGLAFGEPYLFNSRISDLERELFHRVKFIDGNYVGYEMHGDIITGSGRVRLYDADGNPLPYAVGGGFSVGGLGLNDRQTILFGDNFRTKYGPTAYSLEVENPSPVPVPGALGLFLSALFGLKLLRRRFNGGPAQARLAPEA